MWPELFEPHQIGSYNQPVIPPAEEPDDGPFVCVSFNASWLPFVLGSLMQLVNPSSWLVADEPSLQQALDRATKLLDIFGQAGDCALSYQLRFTDGCMLQFSVDAGETWADVDGWDTNFPVCNPPQTQLRLNANCNLQESFDNGSTWPNVPGWAANFRDCTRLEVGPPPPQPFPPTLPPADQACAIATHLAQTVIRGAMTQAVNSINAADSILTFGVALLALVPGVDLVVAGVLGGGAALFEYINSGRISSFNTAIADDTYFDDMKCLIWAAIRDVGYITPDNWPTTLAAIGSTPYSDGDVQFAVAQFAASMGFSGANELQQIGTLGTGDCSGCGEWCMSWSFNTATFQEWDRGSYGTWTEGSGWGTDLYSVNFQALMITISFPATFVTSIEVIGSVGPGNYNPLPVGSVANQDSGALGPLAATEGDFDTTVAIGATSDYLEVRLSSGPPPADKNWVTQVIVRGTGSNPFGADTC